MIRLGMAIGLIIILGLSSLIINIKTYPLMEKRVELSTTLKNLTKTNNALILDIETATKLENIEYRAIHQLDMTPINQIYYLDPV